ncbi:MAG: hypothetical protein ACO3S0_12060 [bacterium]
MSRQRDASSPHPGNLRTQPWQHRTPLMPLTYPLHRSRPDQSGWMWSSRNAKGRRVMGGPAGPASDRPTTLPVATDPGACAESASFLCPATSRGGVSRDDEHC